MPEGFQNKLFYGDNLEILRDYIDDETIDLIYLDPPFNSNQSYNVLFKEQNGSQAASQIKAFEDTWHWDISAASSFHDVISAGGNAADTLLAFEKLLGRSDMMAYLAMMAPRLKELHRVLKSTGTLYLHCDPTASHYLKLLCDGIFGPKNFGNEIIWQRTNAKGLAFTRFAKNHDIILRYTKSDKWMWNPQYTPHNEEYISKFYKHRDPDGRIYRLADLVNPNPDRPNLTYEFLGVTRVWRWTKERMEDAYNKGLVIQTKPGNVPVLKRYLDEQEGTPVGDIWTDIRPIQSQAAEKLGYPTQKPELLLERIIQASSSEGDIILDPFCGCGTTVSVAQRLNRNWIGIDITHLSISLMKYRLKTAFGDAVDYQIIGEPTSLTDARELAHEDKYQFQWWALGLVGARGIDQKKGADKGIDGKLNFYSDGTLKGKVEQIIFSVKAGHVTVSQIRDLVGVIKREKAAIGVFITMEAPTKPMKEEAASAGFYTSGELGAKKYPKIQILTIEEILNGKKVDCPSFALDEGNVTLKKAPKKEVITKRKDGDVTLSRFYK